MSSAICFNLDQSKILSSGNGLIFVHARFYTRTNVDRRTDVGWTDELTPTDGE